MMKVIFYVIIKNGVVFTYIVSFSLIDNQELTLRLTLN